MEKHLIGRVLKPRGIKGELKIQILTNMPEVFLDLKTVYLGTQEYKVTDSSIQNSFAYLNIDGIKSIEDAEEFRELYVSVPRQRLRLDKDEVLASDIIGFDVVDDKGKKLGVLKSIDNYGGGDIFDCGTFSFPNEDEFVIETNMTEKKIVVRADRLGEETIT